MEELYTKYNYKIGPSDDDINSYTYDQYEHTLKGIGLRPFSPTHIKCNMDINGNINISWKRRDRIDGDSWLYEEIPLNEDFEKYELKIYNNSNHLVRSFYSDQTKARYTVDQQIEDFSTYQTKLNISISQISNLFGPGIEKRIIANV